MMVAAGGRREVAMKTKTSSSSSWSKSKSRHSSGLESQEPFSSAEYRQNALKNRNLSLSLAELVMDTRHYPLTRHAFYKYLERQLCPEGFAFLVAVQAYRKMNRTFVSGKRSDEISVSVNDIQVATPPGKKNSTTRVPAFFNQNYISNGPESVSLEETILPIENAASPIAAAQIIVNRFIRPNASMQINISSRMAEDTIRASKTGDPSAFDAPSREVIKLIRENKSIDAFVVESLRNISVAEVNRRYTIAAALCVISLGSMAGAWFGVTTSTGRWIRLVFFIPLLAMCAFYFSARGGI